MELKICHLYPDVLNLYGDQGNITCLRKRLEWRGIRCSVSPLPVGSSAPLGDFDLFFIGGGQDFEQGILLADLAQGKAASIRSAVEDGKVFLAICGGYQMMGNSYKTHSGQQWDFIGAVDLYTLGQPERMIGNYVFRCAPESGGSEIVGFENHSGRTYLGAGVAPLGQIRKGFGNNGEDGTEGCRYKNLFGTYCHGPLLPKNPALADLLLSTALERKYPGVSIPPLEDSIELRAHETMARRVMEGR